MIARERAIGCPSCTASGTTGKCERCRGFGRIRFQGNEEHWIVCGYCLGTGTASCVRCQRSGRIRFFSFLCPNCGFEGPESEGHLDALYADVCPRCGTF